MKKISDIYKSVDSKWQSFINKKYLRFIFKFLPHNIFLFILMIVSLIVIIHTMYINRYDISYIQSKDNALMDPLLVEPETISFDNIKLKKEPDKICFKFATYGRQNNANLKYVLNRNDELIQDEVFNPKEFKDGEYQCFKFHFDIDYEHFNEYSVVFVPLYADSDNTVAIYKNNDTNEPTMFIANKTNIFSIKNIIVLVFGLIFLIINYFINKKEYKIEKFWLLVSIVYILPLAFIIPPYQIPDEPFHFINTYKLTQLDTSKSLSDNYADQYIYVPENYDNINYSDIEENNKVTDYNEIMETLKETDNKWIYSSLIKMHSVFSYIINALNIKIIDIFSNSIFKIYYGGRLFNILLSILLIYFIIKKIPRYKEIVLFITTLPMFVQQFVSYSYDAVINNLSLLIFAIIIYIVFSGKKRLIFNYIILLISIALIFNIKSIYVFSIFIIFFIPDNIFKKKWYKWIYCFSVLILGYILGNKVFGLIGTNINIDVITSTYSYNLEYILHNPLQVFPIAFNTLIKEGWFYIVSLFGYFGWMTYKLNEILIISYIVFMIYLIKSNERINSSRLERIIVLISSLIAIAGIFASMYFYWSSNELYYVDGVQGRYFIPLLIPLILLLMPKKKKKDVDNNIVYLYINIILFHVVAFLVLCYY